MPPCRHFALFCTSAAAAMAACAVARASELPESESVVAGGSANGPAPGAEEHLRYMNALYSSPWTVNPGHAQVETYVIQYARDRDRNSRFDEVRETWTAGPMTIKGGLLDDLDAEFTLTPYTRLHTKDRRTGSSRIQQGFGDIYTGVKYNVYGNDTGHGALALLPFVKIPTSQDDLGSDHVEGGLVVPVAFELPQGWWLILSPEADLSHDIESPGYHVDFANTVYLCHTIVGDLTGYADLYTWLSTENHARPMVLVDFGLTYLWTPNIQIDAGVSLAMTRLGDDVNPYLGFSVRF